MIIQPIVNLAQNVRVPGNASGVFASVIPFALAFAAAGTPAEQLLYPDVTLPQPAPLGPEVYVQWQSDQDCYVAFGPTGLAAPTAASWPCFARTLYTGTIRKGQYDAIRILGGAVAGTLWLFVG